MKIYITIALLVLTASIIFYSSKQNQPRNFIPALGFTFLTPIYDQMTSFISNDIRKEFPSYLNIKGTGKGIKLLDVGCGTGTQLKIIADAFPDAELIGIDIDEQMLSQARKKNLNAKFIHGSADKLPFESESFDRVISVAVFHHLLPSQKKQALKEILRVLKKGGELYIADFGVPANWMSRALFFVFVQSLFDGFETTQDSVEGKLFDYAAQVGFKQVTNVTQTSIMLGTMHLLKAIKP